MTVVTSDQQVAKTDKTGDKAVAALPSRAVSAEVDLVAPTRILLEELNLLPDKDQLEKASDFGSAFSGPPSSVSIIEAGGTALSKWWAAGIGVSAVGLWGSIGAWWARQSGDIQTGVLWAAAVATGALVLGLAYILGSDVRGRSAAMVATIDARARIAEAVLREAGDLYTPDSVSASPANAEDTSHPKQGAMLALPAMLSAEWSDESSGRPHGGPDEKGWIATVARFNADNSIDFLLSKDRRHRWVSSENIRFAAGGQVDGIDRIFATLGALIPPSSNDSIDRSKH
ncbi:MAG: hypothetical protein JWN91_2817 [Nocardioides sp.]|nr:hypothetical protein [Nocardioides sp.]